MYNTRVNDTDILTFTLCRNFISSIDTGRMYKVYKYLVDNKIINKYDMSNIEINNTIHDNDNNINGSINSIIINNIDTFSNNEDDIISKYKNELTDQKSLHKKRIDLFKEFTLKDIHTYFSKDEIDNVQHLIPDKKTQEIALTLAAIRNDCQLEEEKEKQKLQDFIDEYVALRHECLQQKVKLLEYVEQIIDIQRKRNENSRRDNQIDRARLATRVPGATSIILR